MFATLLFVVLQGLIWVPAAVFMFLLPGLGVLGKRTGEVLGLGIWAGLEVSLIVTLIYFVRRHLWGQAKPTAAEFQAQVEVEERKPVLFTERRLEAAMVATALGTVIYGMVLGFNMFAIRIAVIVIEEFALLFMLMFCLVRLAVTKRLRPGGLVSLIVIGISPFQALKD
jgi:hypothetical protein